jgi:undecaprenyl-diphosphatase
MSIVDAIILGIIEGITEFLPVSSTGHLTIAERLLGYDISDPAMTAFTAFIQVGATLSTIIFFRKDIWRVVTAWITGITGGSRDNTDYRMGWAIIIGSIPIAVIGLLFKDQIETGLRSLWFVAIGLIVWSGVMYIAERYAKQSRPESSATWKDTLFVGVMQCIALVPGVSRSGATISAALFKGFDRMTATRLSFFLSIPALMAAGIFQAITQADDIGERIGWMPTLVATIVSFIVAYIAVAWLLKYIATHTFTAFIWYRLALGSVLIVLLSTGVMN